MKHIATQYHFNLGTEPLRLVAETGTDWERIAADNARANADQKAAATAQPELPETVQVIGPALLSQFIAKGQMAVMKAGLRGEESAYFREKIVEVCGIIERMPVSYQTEGQGDKALVLLHYFRGGADWFIIERDSNPDGEGQQQAFGLADLYRDGGEIGYISIAELIANGVELDLHWKPQTIGEVRAKRLEAAGR